MIVRRYQSGNSGEPHAPSPFPQVRLLSVFGICSRIKTSRDGVESDGVGRDPRTVASLLDTSWEKCPAGTSSLRTSGVPSDIDHLHLMKLSPRASTESYAGTVSYPTWGKFDVLASFLHQTPRVYTHPCKLRHHLLLSAGGGLK